MGEGKGNTRAARRELRGDDNIAREGVTEGEQEGN